MQEHIPAVLAAAQHVQQTVKYIPMTAKDGKTAEEAGIFAVAVVVAIGLLRALTGRKPATSTR